MEALKFLSKLVASITPGINVAGRISRQALERFTKTVKILEHSFRGVMSTAPSCLYTAFDSDFRVLYENVPPTYAGREKTFKDSNVPKR